MKKNLTSFDELDKEFYDIIKSKLKVDLKDKNLKKDSLEQNNIGKSSDLTKEKDGIILESEEEATNKVLEDQVKQEFQDDKFEEKPIEKPSSRNEKEESKINEPTEASPQSPSTNNVPDAIIIDDTNVVTIEQTNQGKFQIFL